MRWLPTLSFSPSQPSTATAAADNHRRKARLFGNSKKCGKLRHVADHDAKSHPTWQNDSDEDAPAAAPSPTSIRSSTSVAPQPLPLPELSAAAAWLRQRDSDCRLPSPKDVPSPTGGNQGLEDRGAAATGTGFRMRRYFFWGPFSSILCELGLLHTHKF